MSWPSSQPPLLQPCPRVRPPPQTVSLMPRCLPKKSQLQVEILPCSFFFSCLEFKQCQFHSLLIHHKCIGALKVSLIGNKCANTSKCFIKIWLRDEDTFTLSCLCNHYCCVVNKCFFPPTHLPPRGPRSLNAGRLLDNRCRNDVTESLPQEPRSPGVRTPGSPWRPNPRRPPAPHPVSPLAPERITSSRRLPPWPSPSRHCLWRRPSPS